MKYAVYKLEFISGVHFGTGVLNESGISFCADTLFSALYMEAMKLGAAEEFYTQAQAGKLLFSDAFPYIGDQYFLPKPMLYVEPKEKGNSVDKKFYKKLKYLSSDQIQSFLSGTLQKEDCCLQEPGKEESQIMAAVRNEGEDTLPYHLGNYRFGDGNGLYIIAAYEEENDKMLLEELLESLSYAGIGGKRSSGKGRFTLKYGKHAESLLKILEQRTGRYMLLSSALPREDELDQTVESATYLLQKRSGFVASADYADEQRKKKDMYTMQAGSCFQYPFSGDIYDVSDGGAHPVYRYAKALFLEV